MTLRFEKNGKSPMEAFFDVLDEVGGMDNLMLQIAEVEARNFPVVDDKPIDGSVSEEDKRVFDHINKMVEDPYAREKVLDPCTFGGTPAAIALADMLNKSDDIKLRRKVSSLWTQYSQGAHQIRKGIDDEGFRNKLLSLWTEHCRQIIDMSMIIPDKMKSYLINLERTLLKRIRRGEYDEE